MPSCDFGGRCECADCYRDPKIYNCEICQDKLFKIVEEYFFTDMEYYKICGVCEFHYNIHETNKAKRIEEYNERARQEKAKEEERNKQRKAAKEEEKRLKKIAKEEEKRMKKEEKVGSKKLFSPPSIKK